MPVPNASHDMLSPMLRQRLERSLPLQEQAATVEALGGLLHSVRNVTPIPHGPPPADPANRGVMAQLYRRLVTPVAGTPEGPFSVGEEWTVRMIHYLDEVDRAPPLATPEVASGTPLPQSHMHAHLLYELRREFGLLGFPETYQWRELAVNDAAAGLVAESTRKGLQPTEVRAFSARELPWPNTAPTVPVVVLLAAWNAAAPPPTRPDAASGPHLWDPSNPLDNRDGAPDLLRAPLVLQWSGLMPRERL